MDLETAIQRCQFRGGRLITPKNFYATAEFGTAFLSAFPSGKKTIQIKYRELTHFIDFLALNSNMFIAAAPIKDGLTNVAGFDGSMPSKVRISVPSSEDIKETDLVQMMITSSDQEPTFISVGLVDPEPKASYLCEY